MSVSLHLILLEVEPRYLSCRKRNVYIIPFLSCEKLFEFRIYTIEEDRRKRTSGKSLWNSVSKLFSFSLPSVSKTEYSSYFSSFFHLPYPSPRYIDPSRFFYITVDSSPFVWFDPNKLRSLLFLPRCIYVYIYKTIRSCTPDIN